MITIELLTNGCFTLSRSFSVFGNVRVPAIVRKVSSVCFVFFVEEYTTVFEVCNFFILFELTASQIVGIPQSSKIPSLHSFFWWLRVIFIWSNCPINWIMLSNCFPSLTCSSADNFMLANCCKRRNSLSLNML